MTIAFWAAILIFGKSHISDLSHILEKLRAGKNNSAKMHQENIRGQEGK